MDVTWAQEELSGIELGDARLDKRAAVLLDELGRKPSASIPIACGGWGETLAAYRFLGNDKCQWEDILAPHAACTLKRMADHPVVLCIQDTTVLDFNGQKIEGLGPLSYEAQRGMFVHPTLAVTPERLQLGLLDSWMWAREFKDKNGVRPGINESIRWIEGYERVAERALELPETRLVYVTDREGDLLPLMQKGNSLGFAADILVRSKHNRVLATGEGKLWDQVGATESLGQIEFLLPGRKGKPARQVKQELRILRVKFKSGKAGETFEMTAILAREINAPAGVKAVEWRLLTNRNPKTLEEAAELIDWYRCRWEIEIYQAYCLHKSVFKKLTYFIAGLVYPDTLGHTLFA
jgi:Transposase DNA-binding